MTAAPAGSKFNFAASPFRANYLGPNTWLCAHVVLRVCVCVWIHICGTFIPLSRSLISRRRYLQLVIISPSHRVLIALSINVRKSDSFTETSTSRSLPYFFCHIFYFLLGRSRRNTYALIYKLPAGRRCCPEPQRWFLLQVDPEP